ncbi:MAG: dipeptide epimerase, partial [Bacteroidetes bacterium]
MIDLILHPLNLRLARPFGIARWTRTHQPSLVVELRYQGMRAWGEAAANPYYGVTVEGMRQRLETLRPALQAWNPAEPPEAAWAAWDDVLGSLPAAQAA